MKPLILAVVMVYFCICILHLNVPVLNHHIMFPVLFALSLNANVSCVL